MGVVDSLKKENVPFCVLRNYERYPNSFGGDIDILVLPEFAEEIDIIVRRTADDIGGRVWDYCRKKDIRTMPRTIFRVKLGENGFIFSVEDIEILSFYMSKLVSNKEKRDETGKKSFMAVKEYSYRKGVEGIILTLYHINRE